MKPDMDKIIESVSNGTISPIKANCIFCKKDFYFEYAIMQKLHESGFPAICLKCTEKLTHKPKEKTP